MLMVFSAGKAGDRVLMLGRARGWLRCLLSLSGPGG